MVPGRVAALHVLDIVANLTAILIGVHGFDTDLAHGTHLCQSNLAIPDIRYCENIHNMDGRSLDIPSD